MSKCLSLTALAVALTLITVAAALLRPERSGDFGPDDVWKGRAIARRIQEQERFAVELIEGRLTLFEAAAAFRRLDAELRVTTAGPILRRRLGGESPLPPSHRAGVALA